MIFLSQTLTSLLNEIKNDKVVDSILKLSKKESNVISNNYIDITNLENDSITFIHKSKINKINNDNIKFAKFVTGNALNADSKRNFAIFGILKFNPASHVHPQRDMIYKVVSTAKSPITDNTYTKVEIKHTEYNGTQVNRNAVINSKYLEFMDITYSYWTLYRQTSKVGRFFKKILSDNNIELTDVDYETFVNNYKSIHDKSYGVYSNFDIVKGSDIEHYYKRKNYVHDNNSVLHNSCMCTVKKKYFHLYSKNKDKVEMIILKDKYNPELICARALVWTMDNGFKLMDRIYTVNDSDVNLFRMFAIENGFAYKKQNNNGSDLDIVYPDGTVENDSSVTINLNNSKFKKYPYLDTFKYLSIDDGIISNNWFTGCVKLESTEGYYFSDN